VNRIRNASDSERETTMRERIHRLIKGLWREHGRKIITAIDAALVIAAALIVLALAEIGAAR
jgi:hypothetical protein